MKIFRRVKRVFYRRRLLKNNFFEGVTFEYEDRRIKNAILSWIYDLRKYNGITIYRFSYLLEKFEGVIFPVRITESFRGLACIDLTIVDVNDNKYKIEFYEFGSKERTTYDIHEDTQNNRITYEYKIQKDSIILKKKYILPVKDDGTNEKYDIKIEYDGITTVTLNKDNDPHKISIFYNQQLNRFEKEICEYIFSLVLVSPINNVFTNFVDVVQIFKSNNVTEEYLLAIKSIKEKVTLSEITMTNNVVTMYSYTEEKSEYQKCFYSNSLRERLEDFISKYKS